MGGLQLEEQLGKVPVLQSKLAMLHVCTAHTLPWLPLVC